MYVKIFLLVKIFSNLQFLEYYIVHLYNSLVLGMIWSLIPHVEYRPPISFPKNAYSLICHLKSFFHRKGSPYTLGETLYMPLLYWKIMWGYMFPQYLQVSGLKLISVLDLTKMRTIWQISSVGWGVNYIRTGMLSVQIPLGTTSRHNPLMKSLLTFN